LAAGLLGCAKLVIAKRDTWRMSGKVIRDEWFHDQQQALEAAGLEE
jgi:hypothetical protein